MAQDEQVLVIERKVFEKAGAFQGLVFDAQHYLDIIFAPGVPRFMKRPLAEKDPSFKQLIPYVIMSCNGKYLSYVRGRRAGETRLVGLRSIGIGGHINDSDLPLFRNFDSYLEAVRREVDEEVCVEAKYSDKVVALLNDESNEVGSVHLGIVHHWVLDSPQVIKREQMITQMSFMTPDELRAVRDTMETWSGLCLDHISQIQQHTTSG